jgi:lambda family phage minor tail protein L
MPKTPSAGFTAEKNKQESSSLIHLYEVEYTPDTYLYFCDYDQDVTYPAVSGGQLYVKFPISHDQLSENSDGSVDQVRVSAANADRILGGYVELYNGLRGMRVNIKTVFISLLDDASAYIEDTFVVDSCVIGETEVSLLCTSRLDVMDVQLPGRRFLNRCPWTFKGTICLYSGAGTTCDKSLTACQVFLNDKRFGGFPGCRMYRSL